MEQIFKKWYPYDNLDTMYDVDDIWMRPDGYTLILLPDGKYKEEETELLKKYIDLAPREDFRDILEAMERFPYFESHKKADTERK